MFRSMETSLYDDSSFLAMNGKFKPTKRPATLEFGSPTTKRRKPLVSPAMLTTDDINKFKLMTPEIERFIKESFPPGSLKTPTPTLLKLTSQNVTEEQEEFVKGFIEALAVKHQSSDGSDNFTMNISIPGMDEENVLFSTSGLPTTSTSTRNYTGLLPTSQSSTVSTAVVSSMVKPSTSTFLPNIRPPSVESCSSNSYPGTVSMCALPKHIVVKEELQTVPSDSSSMGMSPPTSPINLEDQERIKLERKRYRNRIAATKCRQRKLEKISKLEKKVNELKDENAKLGNIATQLRNQVCSLKEEVLNHAKHGCEIMIAHGF